MIIDNQNKKEVRTMLYLVICRSKVFPIPPEFKDAEKAMRKHKGANNASFT